MKTVLASILMGVVLAGFAFADSTVAEVQRSLKEQGFYYGEITGQKDADTTAAIRRFQIRNGLEITGELNDETLNALKSAESKTTQVSPPNRTAPAPDDSDLRPGPETRERDLNSGPVSPMPPRGPDQWDDRPNAGRPMPGGGGGIFAGTPYETAPMEVQRKVIIDAQRILARRGLFRNEVDGAYTPDMEFSLRAYQSKIGLPTTGRLDLETLAALELLPGAHAPVFTPRRPVVRPNEPPVRGEWVRP